MQKIKTNKFSVLLFLLVFFILPLRETSAEEWWEDQGYNVINSDTTWKKEDTHFFNKKVVVVNGAKLTIEKGATVKFGKNDIFLSSLDVIDGTIIAEGTREEKIIFTADEEDGGVFNIDFSNNPEREASFFRYVEISNGGYIPQMVKNSRKIPFIHTAIALEGGVPAFQYFSGKMHMENCEFKNNIYGDISAGGFFSFENSDYLEIVNSNFNGDASQLAINSSIFCYNEETEEECPSKFILKNNWYGDLNGPSGEVLNDETNGVSVIGSVILDSWRKSDLIADPVIIIPGITGSEKVSNKWKLDPILHTYDDLVASLEENGYEKEKNLFEFPYEWRNENSITAQSLREKIQTILTETKISKADIVAHSMGGLVARYYVENDIYENNIDQLITLGTPHRGSVKAYLRWEAGEGFFGIEELIAKHHFENEAYHKGYDNVFSYIQEKVLSVKELLPDYDYLFGIAENSMINYPDNYPQNNFLEELNEQGNIEKMEKVNWINIIGNLENEKSTIAKIRVVDSTVSDRWEHGMPENFYNNETDQGLEKSNGDETVPLVSAESVPANKKIELNSTHNNLPTFAQCEILSELTGKNDCSRVDKIHIPNILIFNLFSPIDIQIIAPSGQWAGKNINNLDEDEQIDGAYYTGYDTENEFLTIPNPENGEYKVITEGTSNGEYKIEMAKISEDENGIASEISGEIIGTAENGVQTEKTVEVLEEEIVTEEKDTVPATIIIDSPQNKSYQSDEIVPLEFTTTDDSSGIDEEKTEIFLDGEIFSQDKIDMAYLTKGEHNLKISAMDKAGNSTEEAITFSIQPTIDSIMENIDHYYADKLITEKATKNYLDAKLKIIKMQKMFYEAIKVSPWPANFKNRLLKNLARNINREIENLLDDIQNKKSISKNILEPAKSILIGNLGEIGV